MILATLHFPEGGSPKKGIPHKYQNPIHKEIVDNFIKSEKDIAAKNDQINIQKEIDQIQYRKKFIQIRYIHAKLQDCWEKGDYKQVGLYLAQLNPYGIDALNKALSEESLVQMFRIGLDYKLRMRNFKNSILAVTFVDMYEDYLKEENVDLYWDIVRRKIEYPFEAGFYKHVTEIINDIFNDQLPLPNDYTKGYVFAMKADSLFALKKYDETLSFLASMASYLGDDFLDDEELKSHFFTLRGKCSFEKKDYQSAFDDFQTAVDCGHGAEDLEDPQSAAHYLAYKLAYKKKEGYIAL